MDEVSGLQRAVGAFSSKLTVGQPTKLVVDQRDEGFECRPIARSPGEQQLGDVVTCQLSSPLSAFR
jgi:hypothetical protein